MLDLSLCPLTVDTIAWYMTHICVTREEEKLRFSPTGNIFPSMTMVWVDIILDYERNFCPLRRLLSVLISSEKWENQINRVYYVIVSHRSWDIYFLHEKVTFWDREWERENRGGKIPIWNHWRLAYWFSVFSRLCP